MSWHLVAAAADFLGVKPGATFPAMGRKQPGCTCTNHLLTLPPSLTPAFFWLTKQCVVDSSLGFLFFLLFLFLGPNSAAQVRRGKFEESNKRSFFGHSKGHILMIIFSRVQSGFSKQPIGTGKIEMWETFSGANAIFKVSGRL